MSHPSSPGLIHRRTFLHGAAALPLALSAGGLLAAEPGGKAAPAAGLIPRVKDPVNLEFPFNSLKNFITPNNLFYVRNHFPQPKMDAKSWKLRIEGAVDKPLELNYAELLNLPTSSLTATLECAGN